MSLKLGFLLDLNVRCLNCQMNYIDEMASEIFGTAAVFWVLIPVGLLGGALLLKLQEN